MQVDPAIGQIFVEDVRAAVKVRPAPVRLEAGLVEKIKQKVPVFSGMTPDCLMRTLAVAQYLLLKAQGIVSSEGDIADSLFVLVAGGVLVEKPSGGTTQHHVLTR